MQFVLFSYVGCITYITCTNIHVHVCGIPADDVKCFDRRFPVDNAVDIAFIEEDEDGEEGLVLIESDDDLMDQLFPIAKELVEQDEAAKLALYRTPATLTLAGNLGIDDDVLTWRSGQWVERGNPVVELITNRIYGCLSRHHIGRSCHTDGHKAVKLKVRQYWK